MPLPYGAIPSTRSWVNVDRLHTSLHSHFQSAGGLDQKAATNWSQLCVEIYHFTQTDRRFKALIKANKLRSDAKDVWEGGAKVLKARKDIAQSAGPLRLSTVSYGLSGAAGIAGVLVDRFSPYINQHFIQLDDRGVKLAVLCFGLAAAGAAPVLIPATIAEGFVLALGVLAAGMNGYDFGKAMQNN